MNPPGSRPVGTTTHPQAATPSPSPSNSVPPGGTGATADAVPAVPTAAAEGTVGTTTHPQAPTTTPTPSPSIPVAGPAAAPTPESPLPSGAARVRRKQPLPRVPRCSLGPLGCGASSHCPGFQGVSGGAPGGEHAATPPDLSGYLLHGRCTWGRPSLGSRGRPTVPTVQQGALEVTNTLFPLPSLYRAPGELPESPWASER